MKSEARGFTLIELLVGLSIIGLIAGIGLPAVSSFREKARIKAAKSDIEQFVVSVEEARLSERRVLKDITKNVCTDCGCQPSAGVSAGNIKALTKSHQCHTKWQTSLKNLSEAAFGDPSQLDGLLFDPWGNPYLLDENEYEINTNVKRDCRRDRIMSAGSDGIWSLYGRSSDDITQEIPVYTAFCKDKPSRSDISLN